MVFTILLQAIYIPQQQLGMVAQHIMVFYEFLQDDGIYANAFSSLQGNLIRFDDYSSSGGTQTTFVSNTQDYFNIPSVEEITGINRYTTLFSGRFWNKILSA